MEQEVKFVHFIKYWTYQTCSRGDACYLHLGGTG